MSSPDRSSPGFDDSHLSIRLHPSRLQLCLAVLVSLPAILGLWTLSGIDPALKAALALALGTHLLVHAGSVCLLPPAAINRVEFSGGQWRLCRKNGEVLTARLRAPVFNGTWFIVLRFRTSAGTTDIVVARDSQPPDRFRRLRVFLRCRAAQLLSAA